MRDATKADLWQVALAFTGAAWALAVTGVIAFAAMVYAEPMTWAILRMLF